MLLSTSIHLYAANHKVSRSPWGFFTQPRLSCKELQLWIGTVANKIIQLPLHNQVYRQNRQTFSRLRRTNQTKAIEIARHKECSESFPQIQLKAQLIMRCESQRCSHKISKWPIRKHPQKHHFILESKFNRIDPPYVLQLFIYPFVGHFYPQQLSAHNCMFNSLGLKKGSIERALQEH